MKETKAHKSGRDSKRNKTNAYQRNYLFKIVVWGLVVVCFVFFILPTLFVLLGAMWPEHFSGAKAVEQLNENINSWVGIIGLALAVFSLYYSFETNKSMDKQQQQSGSTLQEISHKLGEVEKGVSTNTERLFTYVRDKQYDDLRSSDESKEL